MSLGNFHFKKEGAPLHPDDIDADLSQDAYLTQLEAYCKYFGVVLMPELKKD